MRQRAFGLCFDFSFLSRSGLTNLYNQIPTR